MRGRTSPKLEPELAWTTLPGAPLTGLAGAFLAGGSLAGDAGSQLYLLNAHG